MTFEEGIRHLPQATIPGSRLRPDSPVQRALQEAERRALHTAWKIDGESYARALERAAGFSECAMHWMRTGGRDRAILREQLRNLLLGVLPEDAPPPLTASNGATATAAAPMPEPDPEAAHSDEEPGTRVIRKRRRVLRRAPAGE